MSAIVQDPGVIVSVDEFAVPIFVNVTVLEALDPGNALDSPKSLIVEQLFEFVEIALLDVDKQVVAD